MHMQNGRGWRAWIPVAIAFATLLLVPPVARSQDLTILYSFNGGDGANPDGGLLLAEGQLYGTTYEGGYGYGVVFELTASGTEIVLHSFVGGDGWWPTGALVADAEGNLYGVTLQGGVFMGGNVFKMAKQNEVSVHVFSGGLDGVYPRGGVVRDPAGNLYGTTENGGVYSNGTVYKIDLAAVETTIYSFTGGDDGQSPLAPVILGSAGNLYGTTENGGRHGAGTVFKVSKSGQESTLYSFTGGADGAAPWAGLISDSSGNLYGTTSSGGDTSCNPFGGCGTVFKVGSAGQLTVLHTFTGSPDGAVPYGSLLQDSQGNLYGTASSGGDTACNPPYGCGTVFEISRAGAFSVLHTFTGSPDGATPYAGLIMDGQANLYGTTWGGGKYNQGTVFELTH